MINSKEYVYGGETPPTDEGQNILLPSILSASVYSSYSRYSAYIPFFFNTPLSISGFSLPLHSSSSAAEDDVTICIYENNSGKPGKLIRKCGDYKQTKEDKLLPFKYTFESSGYFIGIFKRKTMSSKWDIYSFGNNSTNPPAFNPLATFSVGFYEENYLGPTDAIPATASPLIITDKTLPIIGLRAIKTEP